MSRGLVSGRADDQDLSVIENRIEVYTRKTAPLVAYYQARGRHFGINGMGSIPEIAQRLKETVDRLPR